MDREIAVAFRILVVDDEPDVEALLLQRFRKRIRERELEFSFAANGQQALEFLARSQDVDLVLTDINMPVMDGLTLLSRLEGSDASVISIIISAYGDMDNIRSAMNLGAFDFVTKPINFRDLDATLNKSLKALTRNRLAAQEHERLASLQRELDIASQIQQAMVPQIPHDWIRQRGLEVGACIVPARKVGGDFYDFFTLDDGRVGFCIADVSGKGIPAALFMTMSKTLLKAAALSGLSPRGCLDYVNRLLAPDNETCMFLTVLYAVLDPTTGDLCYANGGHNPPVWIRAGGKLEALTPVAGGMVGVDEDVFEEHTVNLLPGDVLFLYTDGVTEAASQSDELLGMARLKAILSELGPAHPTVICEQVLETVRAFVGAAEQSDDITMLALRYSSPSLEGGACE